MSEVSKKALEEYREKVKNGEAVKPKQLNPVEASNADPKSRAKAIKAMCFHCVGGYDDGNWRKTVKACTSCDTCPLYKLRPYQ